MTEDEKNEKILTSIKEIYISLTEKEPTPDEEIDAREQLIILFNSFTDNLSLPEQKDLIETIKDKLEKWDTLEDWFTETSIPDDIKLLLNSPDLESQLTEIKDIQIQDKDINESDILSQNSSHFDVNEIVSEVSQRFKGEIDSLKDTIDGLKKELDKKSETLNKISKKKIKKITPNKTSKLAPPVIKIPVIKKVKFTSKSQIDESTPPILPKKEQESSLIEEVKVPTKKAEVKEFTPIPTKPEGMIAKNNKELTPIPINKVKKKPEITTEVIEVPKNVPIITEKKKITPIVSEIYSKPTEVGEKSGNNKLKPFSVDPPKIRSMSVEEVETESIKTSSSDLFNVLSQVGDKHQDIPKKEKESPKFTEKKEEKPIEIKKVKESEQPLISSFVEFNKEKPESLPAPEGNTENLPVDKDDLYQELIALEGKRYAVEKGYKELEASYNKGSISEMQYKQKNDDIKAKMLKITNRITTIRRLISSL